ncbi:MAG: hypothetical protein AAB907_00525, partial [Patescibacteria group bacterium]
MLLFKKNPFFYISLPIAVLFLFFFVANNVQAEESCSYDPIGCWTTGSWTSSEHGDCAPLTTHSCSETCAPGGGCADGYTADGHNYLFGYDCIKIDPISGDPYNCSGTYVGVGCGGDTHSTWTCAPGSPGGGAICGNNIVEGSEQCDDGNTT